MKHLEVVAAILEYDGKILCMERGQGKFDYVSFKYEFPGGKIEAGETGEQCIIRECQEELSVTLSVERKLTDIVFESPDRTVHLHFYICEIAAGSLILTEHNNLAWVDNVEILDYNFCPADKKMLDKIGVNNIF